MPKKLTKKPTYKPNTAISLYELFKRFPDEEAARRYLEKDRWNGKITCGHCNSQRIVETPRKNKGYHKGYYRCKDCRKEFSVRTNSIFADSNIDLHIWFHAFYYMVTDRKGISSIELSKKLGITQKSAWHMEGRIRESMEKGVCDFFFESIAEVEMDETGIGGIEENKHPDKKLRNGRGSVGKTPLFGIKGRNGGKTFMQVVKEVSKETLHPIIVQKVKPGAVLNTDQATCYCGIEKLGYTRKKVNHKKKEYVRGSASTNGIESVWATLKRGIHGVFHHVSDKHLQRYANEFAFRLNDGNCRYDTMDRIDGILAGCWGKKLSYKMLTGKVAW
ncbi:MAG: IS1595 family transposase [Chitinispirillales bacterium]|nr:IS1595 family transposase [Chitinispirillales bacterium]